ncbi:hypothetical protein TNCV_1172621 [Trichonephila clavipes]|uniref:Uncharacterized protein n=1 Tax=Trichonephila clavipes TaxID=2585209 RepID=A0A8X6SA78_TRICX|nr:hypothetical protein TNCV_1172621 [Trichonephila clavipes]
MIMHCNELVMKYFEEVLINLRALKKELISSTLCYPAWETRRKSVSANKHQRTIMCHPRENEITERYRCILELAIICHHNPDWIHSLSIILLGLYTAGSDVFQSTPAKFL